MSNLFSFRVRRPVYWAALVCAVGSQRHNRVGRSPAGNPSIYPGRYDPTLAIGGRRQVP